jgi:glycosyltransferase involved in cell wall biosynthesis
LQLTLRVLEVIESFGGGSMQIVLTIAERLAAEGHDIAVVHGRVAESPRRPRSLVPADVELFPLGWSRSVASEVAVARELRQIAGAWRPDVVHLHSSFAGIVGALALSGRVPLIYTPHGYSFLRRGRSAFTSPAYRLLERWVARRVDLVGAVSDSEAVEARGIGARRVEIVPNGIPELDEPAPAAKEGARPSVVVVGRIDPARRPVAAAGILGSVSDVADAEWIGAGETPGSAAALSDAGVRVSGWLERAEVQRRLAAATACLHWSAWDAQPLAVLEAMANDAVVVASDIAPNRELLGSRQVCATAGDAGRLLRAVLTDAGLRGELLADQRRRRGRYAARRMVSDWLELYTQVARGA